MKFTHNETSHGDAACSACSKQIPTGYPVHVYQDGGGESQWCSECHIADSEKVVKMAQIQLEQAKRLLGYATMANRAMAEMLIAGDAIDVSRFRLADDTYQFPDGWFEEVTCDPDFSPDFYDAERERWIFSIGKSRSFGFTMAATDTRYHENKDFQPRWLR